MADPLASLDLNSIPLFAGLPEMNLRDLKRKLRYEEVPADTLVVERRNPSPEACVLLEGTMKVYIDRDDDDDVVLAVVGGGELIGELNLIDHLGRSANVVTVEPCRL